MRVKVLIFGATGKLGRYVTAEALEAGHQVTAFARNPQSLNQHPDLSLHAGNAYHAGEVEAAMPGHDAVIIAIGSGMSRKNTIRSTCTRHVISSMTKHGVNDWTIVRPSAFRDYPADGNYEVGFSSTAKGLKLVISKQDIAKFIVKELTERRFAGTAVSLSR